jgi:hypothetical protein
MWIGIIFYGSAHEQWGLLSYKINKHEIIQNFCISKKETTFKCAEEYHLKTELPKAKNQDESPINGASETNHTT